MANSVLRRRIVVLEAKAPPIAGGCRCRGTMALYDEDEPLGPHGQRVFCSQCGLTKAEAHVSVAERIYAMLGTEAV